MSEEEIQPNPDFDTPGYDKLWAWFGLSYASFLILPRSFLHEMPDEWQGRLVDLLREFGTTFSNIPGEYEFEYHVSVRKEGKYVPCPEFLKNYRHPDRDMINSFRPEEPREEPKP